MKRSMFICLFIFFGLCVDAKEPPVEGHINFDFLFQDSKTNINLHGKQYSKKNTDYVMLDWDRNTIAYASDAPHPEPVPASDPYIFNYKGITYIMILDNHDGKLNENDIFGFKDGNKNLFNSLQSLDKNKDNKLTLEELKNSGVRCVQIDKKGTLLINSKNKDFDLALIDYIDLKNIKFITNSANTGIYGHFNIYLNTDIKSEKLIIGYVVYTSDELLKNLFRK